MRCTSSSTCTSARCPTTEVTHVLPDRSQGRRHQPARVDRRDRHQQQRRRRPVPRDLRQGGSVRGSAWRHPWRAGSTLMLTTVLIVVLVVLLLLFLLGRL